MQLWSRGIPGGLVDAVSWPVVCNHSPTSHFVKGIHHWRQKSNLQAAMSIWAIGFKWAIPRKCHAFLGLGVFKTTVLVGEYFLNLFTSFGSSNWSRKIKETHPASCWYIISCICTRWHDISLFQPRTLFHTLFPSCEGFLFNELQHSKCLETQPELISDSDISLFLSPWNTKSTYQQTQTHDAKDPRPWKKSTNSRAFQWRWSSRFPRRTGFCGWNSRSQKGPLASMTSGGPGEPSKCCGCNTFAVQIEGVVGMPCQRVFFVCCWWFDNEKIGDK